jgi:hypothetical protein
MGILLYKIKDAWYKIRDFFYPRQDWLFKKIPNHWIDKDTLWETCILEGIKHYVEEDGGLGWEAGDYEKSQSDPDYPEWQKKLDKEVKENYDLITHTLPSLERDLEIAWSKVPHFDLSSGFCTKDSYEKTYGEVDRIEKEISDLKTKIMIWAVTNRASLWT